jgi:predicted lipid-binding transport protein (Tim44 family)
VWLYLLVALLVGLCFFGGIFAGGVFTIVLVPLAVIAFLSALAYALIAGAAKRTSGGSADPAQGARGPATRTSQTSNRRGPSSPEQLVDARRGQQ